MRLHALRVVHAAGPARYRDLMYTVMFIVGAPLVVRGAIYLVDSLFDLL